MTNQPRTAHGVGSTDMVLLSSVYAFMTGEPATTRCACSRWCAGHRGEETDLAVTVRAEGF